MKIINHDMDVTFNELDKILLSLKFEKNIKDDTAIYWNMSLNAKIKIALPVTPNAFINKGLLQAYAVMLQEQGIISNASVLFKLIDNQRFIKENVLV